MKRWPTSRCASGLIVMSRCTLSWPCSLRDRWSPSKLNHRSGVAPGEYHIIDIEHPICDCAGWSFNHPFSYVGVAEWAARFRYEMAGATLLITEMVLRR